MNMRANVTGRRRRITTRVHGRQPNQGPWWTGTTPRSTGLRPDVVGDDRGRLAATALHLAAPAIYAPTWIPMIRILVLWVLAVVVIVLIQGGCAIELSRFVDVMYDWIGTQHL